MTNLVHSGGADTCTHCAPTTTCHPDLAVSPGSQLMSTGKHKLMSPARAGTSVDCGRLCLPHHAGLALTR
jgi:hypothetical protein